jgi:DNA-binding NarL/FixJ family response regulator
MPTKTNLTAHEVTPDGVIDRELTEAEIAQQLLDQETINEIKQQVEGKAAARESALAKLAELGLTAEEIAAL